METATVGRFQQVDSAPAVCLRGSPEDADNFRLRLESHGATVRLLRGSRMKTVGALFGEFASALRLPGSAGGNWDALEECLTGFEGQAPQVCVLIITEAAQLLASAPEDELETFLELVEDVSESWGKKVPAGERQDHPPVAFHVGFQERSESISGLVARLASAGVDPDYVSLPREEEA